MRQLTILYDARCGLCSWARRWMLRQPAFLDLRFVPGGSDAALALFPGVTRRGVAEELVVVDDDGGVYRGGDAWIICLYALERHREWSLRLAHPALRPLARRAFAMLSKRRGRVARWLQLASMEEIASTLQGIEEPPCMLAGSSSDGRG